jgi:hypothetical protein
MTEANDMAWAKWPLAALCLLPAAAAAQQPAPPQQPAGQQQQPNTWAQLPRMQLERQFAGPLQDTIVQRWRDPVDGTICYIYLPITAQHSPPGAAGFVQYGANTIGSISCVAAPGAAVPAGAPATPQGQKKSAPRPNAANP